MNGIEKITARIETEAKAAAEATLAEAAEQCNEIKARYDEVAQEEYWKLIRAGVKDTELRVQRLGSTAETEAKKSILALKQQMVARAFDRAAELICSMPKKEYVSFLARTVASAARTGSEEILLNERDSALISEVRDAANVLLRDKGLPAELKTGAAPRKIMGGLILKDGDVEVNCGIETLCGLYKNELSAQVADILFTD